MPRTLIFANGILPDPASARKILRDDDIIVCADGGTRHALALGLTPSVIIGDLDSILEEEKRKMKEDGVQILQYPRDKNETDLELALNYAIESGAHEIIVIAAQGNRLDQTLGNLALLTNVQLSTLNVKLDDGMEEAFFCRGRSEVRGRRGDLVSLIPWGSRYR